MDPLRDYVPWPPAVASRYCELGLWLGSSLDQLLAPTLRADPDRIALVDGERRITYAALSDAADRVAAGLVGLGLQAGDRILLQLPNGAPFFEVLFACFRVGVVPVLALPGHRRAELVHYGRAVSARVLVTADRIGTFDHRGLAREVQASVPGLERVVIVGDAQEHLGYDELPASPRELPRPSGADLALFQLSGGSTGTPKLIPRTHDDYGYSVRRSVEVCRFDASTVYLAALPVAHNFPLSSPGTLGTLAAGGTVVLAPSPSPSVAFALIEREGVDTTALVPPLAQLWSGAAASRRGALASLRRVQVGGAPLDAATARRIAAELDVRLQQVYGMAEGLVCYTRWDDPDPVVWETQGRPMSEHDEVRIVDDDDLDAPPGTVGHLLARGPYTIRGYYRSPEHDAAAFSADGFYRTGDLGYRTPEGNLVVCGRTKDQINRGGEKVSAPEVEGHLREHPDIEDAALVAMPDPYLGERARLFVVTRGAAPSLPQVRAFLRERGLAEHKFPDDLRVVEHLPLTRVGKIDKAALRRMEPS